MNWGASVSFHFIHQQPNQQPALIHLTIAMTETLMSCNGLLNTYHTLCRVASSIISFDQSDSSWINEDRTWVELKLQVAFQSARTLSFSQKCINHKWIDSSKLIKMKSQWGSIITDSVWIFITIIDEWERILSEQVPIFDEIFLTVPSWMMWWITCAIMKFDWCIPEPIGNDSKVKEGKKWRLNRRRIIDNE